MLAHVEELARQAQQDEEEESVDETLFVLSEADSSDGVEQDDILEAAVSFESSEQEASLSDETEEVALKGFVQNAEDQHFAAPKRRMRFSFDDQVGGAA